MDLTSPGLLEDLERTPLQFGYPRVVRWVLVIGGTLSLGCALVSLIPDCVDFASGTLCRPLLNYAVIAFFLVMAVISFAFALRGGWVLTLDPGGVEIRRWNQDPSRVSWDQIADVRRSLSGKVVLSTREGRQITAFDANIAAGKELEAFLSGVAWVGRQVPFGRHGFAEALRAAVRSTTLIFRALAPDESKLRSRGYATLIGVSLLVAMVALLFVFEVESLATRILYSSLLLLGAYQALHAYWLARQKYSSTVEVTRHGVTSRSQTGAATFLSWDDLAAAEFEETAAGVEVRSADGNRVLKIGELQYGPIFWQAFWLMGGPGPQDA
ncbi:MAG: hypothetical protein QNJ30_23090 [Kiloniellales bacterium]|nr:hypothetical protein [Kiloniellales bacterium]